MSDREPTLGANGELRWWDDDTGKAIRWWNDPDVTEALLRRDIDAGFHPALVDLANHLGGGHDGDRGEEAEALLRQAVSLGVPDAYEALASLVHDQGHVEQAEQLWRQGIAAGGRWAATSLAYILHERGEDREAYLVLREAAKSGDALAHWILVHSKDQIGEEFQAIDVAFHRNYDGFYSVPCGMSWTLNLHPAGSNSA